MIEKEKFILELMVLFFLIQEKYSMLLIAFIELNIEA